MKSPHSIQYVSKIDFRWKFGLGTVVSLTLIKLDVWYLKRPGLNTISWLTETETWPICISEFFSSVNTPFSLIEHLQTVMLSKFYAQVYKCDFKVLMRKAATSQGNPPPPICHTWPCTNERSMIGNMGIHFSIVVLTSGSHCRLGLALDFLFYTFTFDYADYTLIPWNSLLGAYHRYSC